MWLVMYGYVSMPLVLIEGCYCGAIIVAIDRVERQQNRASQGGGKTYRYDDIEPGTAVAAWALSDDESTRMLRSIAPTAPPAAGGQP